MPFSLGRIARVDDLHARNVRLGEKWSLSETDDGHLAAIPNTDRILLTDTQSTVEQREYLLAYADTATQAASTQGRVYTDVKHAEALAYADTAAQTASTQERVYTDVKHAEAF
eukprot:5737172-Pleurochrysis_carterae.AAC.1